MKSLRRRIINGCITLAALTVLIGGWAVFRIITYQSSLDFKADVVSQRITYAENMVSALERLDSAELLFLLGRTEQAENIFSENNGKFTESLKSMDLAVNDAEGQAVIDSLEQNYSRYQQTFLAMQNDVITGGDPGSRYSTEAFPIFQSLTDDSQLLLEQNQEELQKLTAEIIVVLTSTTKIIMFVIVLVILFAALLGLGFIRSVFNPLHQLAKYIRFTRMGRQVELDENAGSMEINELSRELGRIAKVLQDYERFYKNSQFMEEKNKTNEEPVVAQESVEPVKVTAKKINDNIKMDIQDVSVVELVETAIETLKPQAEAKDIRLVQDIPLDLPEIEADANKVLWVLTNLMGNALRFTQSGGQVNISARVINNQVYLSVSDTGAGMPKEHQDKVFDKFVQMKGKGDSPRGSGIGLTIAREIVQAHHGQIWVESEKEKGATFTFTIPVKTEE